MRIKKTAAGLLAIGMIVQIVTGIIWIACNFPSRWSYPESEYYISVADSWVMDEYTGVLYPALIWVSRIIMGCFGLPFEVLIYFVQLIVAFLCCSAFIWLCRKDENRGRNVLLQSGFAGLYLLTVPLCVQWHLSILPNSLVSSLFLLLMGLCIRVFRNNNDCNIKWMIRISALWALLTLLHPDYWWITLVPVLFTAVVMLRRNGIRIAGIFLAVCIAASVPAMVLNTAVQTPGSSGKIQKSLGAAMVSRVVWPNFDTTYFFWPEEIKAVMTPLQGTEISAQADLVQTRFGPMVEEAYGKEAADRLYWQMTMSCIQIRTKEVLQAALEDFWAYLAAPWQVKTQLDGSGLSYSGWNYDKMKTETPGLTRWYVDYGQVSFRIGILVAFCLGLSGRLKKGRKSVKGSRSLCLFPVICVLSQVIWYTMAGGGMMDYRNVPAVILLWYSLIAGQWRKAIPDEGCAEQIGDVSDAKQDVQGNTDDIVFSGDGEGLHIGAGN